VRSSRPGGPGPRAVRVTGPPGPARPRTGGLTRSQTIGRSRRSDSGSESSCYVVESLPAAIGLDHASNSSYPSHIIPTSESRPSKPEAARADFRERLRVGVSSSCQNWPQAQLSMLNLNLTLRVRLGLGLQLSSLTRWWSCQPTLPAHKLSHGHERPTIHWHSRSRVGRAQLPPTTPTRHPSSIFRIFRVSGRCACPAAPARVFPGPFRVASESPPTPQAPRPFPTPSAPCPCACPPRLCGPSPAGGGRPLDSDPHAARRRGRVHGSGSRFSMRDGTGMERGRGGGRLGRRS
jgi:hypothetical protein